MAAERRSISARCEAYATAVRRFAWPRLGYTRRNIRPGTVAVLDVFEDEGELSGSESVPHSGSPY